MARTRTIRPEFYSDEKLANVDPVVRLLYIGTWTTSDDYGVTKGHPLWLKSQIFPYDNFSEEDMTGWLSELVEIGLLVPFEHRGEHYYHIPKFLKYQKINRPSTTRNPEVPDTLTEDSLSTHDTLTEDSLTKQKQKQKQKYKQKQKQKRASDSSCVSLFDSLIEYYNDRITAVGLTRMRITEFPRAVADVVFSAEDFSLEDFKTAIDGCLGKKFNRADPSRLRPQTIFKDRSTIGSYIEAAKNPEVDDAGNEIDHQKARNLKIVEEVCGGDE